MGCSIELLLTRRRAHPASGPARRAPPIALEVRDRRDALTGLGARDGGLRLPVVVAGTPTAVRYGCRSWALVTNSTIPGGCVRALRMAGPFCTSRPVRHEQVRPVPLPVPARGDIAGAAPGSRRGPGEPALLAAGERFRQASAAGGGELEGLVPRDHGLLAEQLLHPLAACLGIDPVEPASRAAACSG